jgi:peptidoglycan/LPS O-acetylase OafA/YrhL
LNGHFEFGLGWWMIRFDIGVKVFFMISGFILAVPFTKYYLGQGKKINLKQYLIRRLRRLEPPYIISLLIFFFVHLLFLNADFSYLSQSLFFGLFYLHGIILGEPNPINPVTWSLETEAQFYIMIPLFMFILFLFGRKNIVYLLFLAFFALSVWTKNYTMNLHIGNLNSTILVYFVNFLVGIFAAFLYVNNRVFFAHKSYLWDILNVVSIGLMFYFYKPQAAIINIIVLNLSLLLFFISVFKSKLVNWFYTRPLIFTIGGMCYSIYLLHYAFFHLSANVTSKLAVFDNEILNLLIQMVINLPLILIVSSIFFLLFEKPFMNKHWLENLRTSINRIYPLN